MDDDVAAVDDLIQFAPDALALALGEHLVALGDELAAALGPYVAVALGLRVLAGVVLRVGGLDVLQQRLYIAGVVAEARVFAAEFVAERSVKRLCRQEVHLGALKGVGQE